MEGFKFSNWDEPGFELEFAHNMSDVPGRVVWASKNTPKQQVIDRIIVETGGNLEGHWKPCYYTYWEDTLGIGWSKE